MLGTAKSVTSIGTCVGVVSCRHRHDAKDCHIVHTNKCLHFQKSVQVDHWICGYTKVINTF